MRIHNKLDNILNQQSKVKILRFLFSEKDEHTGRAIAKTIGMSASATYETLQQMKKEGLISLRRKGNAILYRASKDNYFAKKLLLPLFEKEKTSYTDIISFIKKRLLKRKVPVVSIAIFGSVAKGQEASSSDIDLLIVVKDKAAKKRLTRLLDDLGVEMGRKFAVSLSPYLITTKAIKTKHARQLPLIKSILDNNRLIYGEPIERILS